ncbi:hypothetical protein H310_02360 [Aphanomyces invadans]|uniref:FYVE-type domain-containing protein n=1 Tax=Aphanomyces invadans TaxID=157072 RepID=A0A024UQU2_9STRA|nr:hypothetical protein H310_02360 [Aphanomyces invadans]ETW07973.1 hypothetical protein H310_02360 [Aphanomyces invadans]RHY30496.1 hypothetical protein DYB32_004271 [Aphanomyces invadans]|eukprot:XP_008864066.1 hypothetical protein H310_02360 [Aphanomyces invadans]
MKPSMPPILLSEGRKEELLAEIDPMIQPLLQSMVPSGDKWEMNFVRNGVTCYDSLRADPYYRLCLSTAVVRSSLDAAMSALATDTTSSLLRAENESLGDRVSNASVICPLRPRTRKSQQHYVGVKWVSYSINNYQQFDMVFCDAVGVGVSPSSGRRFGYRIIRSISIPECPTLSPMPRGHVVFNVIKFNETAEANVLDMQVSINLLCDDVASLSGIFDPYPQTTRLRVYIESYFRKGFTPPPRKSTLLIPPLSLMGGRSSNVFIDQPKKASHCNLCRKKFHWFRRRYGCSECGNVVCSSCTEQFRVGAIRRKVCLVCRCTTTADATAHHSVARSPTSMPHYAPVSYPMYDSEPSPIYDIRTSLWSPRSPRHSQFDRPSLSENLGRSSFQVSPSMHKMFTSSRGAGDMKFDRTVGLPSTPLKTHFKPFEDKVLVDQINRQSVQSTPVQSLQQWNPVDLTARNSMSGQRDSFTCKLRKSLSAGFS